MIHGDVHDANSFYSGGSAGNAGLFCSARDVFVLAAAHGTQVRHLRPSVPTLEDVFARALGEQ